MTAGLPLRGLVLALSLAALALVTPASVAKGPQDQRVRLAAVVAPTSVAAGEPLVVRGRVNASRSRRSALRVRLESKRRGRWHRRAERKIGARPRFRLAWAHAPPSGSVRIRVSVLRRGRRVAKSSVRRVRIRPVDPAPNVPSAPGPAGATPGPTGTSPGVTATPSPGEPSPGAAPAFSVPATTRLYESGDIDSAAAGPADDQATVVVRPGAPAPVIGGHAALGAADGLPHGMFARVLDSRPAEGGGQALVLETAPVDEVLHDVDVSFDGPVAGVLVGESGEPVPGSADHDGSIVIRGDAGRSAATKSAFACSESGGVPRDAEEVWDTGLPTPIEVKIEEPRVRHRFDAGSFFPARPPMFLLQFSGQAVASIGFEAKTGFECELSDDFRRKHRIRIPVGSIGPVPVDLFLEPVLRFSVSASGKVALEQRHYFALTLEKSGSEPLDTRRSHSADPVKLALDSRVDASLFAGGDLSLMLGAAAGTSTNAGAGIYGAFGPEFSLSASAGQGCVSATARLRADVGARLQLYTKRWSLELASLTSPDANLGGPWCDLFDADPGPDGPPVPEPQAFVHVPYQDASHWVWPAESGAWLTVASKHDYGGMSWTWVLPDGEPAASWTAPHSDPSSVVAGGGSTMFVASHSTAGDDSVTLSRIGPDGVEATREADDRDADGSMQRIAVGDDGWLYWLVSLEGGSWLMQLDPHTLRTRHRIRFDPGNSGMLATPTGLAFVNYAGTMNSVPYGVFTSANDDAAVEGHPRGPLEPRETSGRLALGVDGSVVEYSYQWSATDRCAAGRTSRRGPDGTQWVRSLSTLVGDPLGGECEPLDVEALADGSVVYTLKGRAGHYLLWVSPGGSRRRLARIAGADATSVSTVADDGGTVLTSFTQHIECPDEALEDCARVRVVGFRGPDRVIDWSYAGPYSRAQVLDDDGALTTGEGQVLVRMGQWSPEDGWTFQLRTVLAPVGISRHPSFTDGW